MDDYSLVSLNESKNEWCVRLLNILTPHFMDGIHSILKESLALCHKEKEPTKYLMTFQNYLSKIPHWNNYIIENERERIIESSQCDYLEDLITCIHIIQLKMLSCMRVSHKNKKIDIAIPSLDTFIHTTYVNIAQIIYKNVYLFEQNVTPLVQQKNMREIEFIIRECILNTVRDNIPVTQLLRTFMDESEEYEYEEIVPKKSSSKPNQHPNHNQDINHDPNHNQDPNEKQNMDSSLSNITNSFEKNHSSNQETVNSFFSNADSENIKVHKQEQEPNSSVEKSSILKTSSPLDDISFPSKDNDNDGDLTPSKKKISFSDEIVSFADDGEKTISNTLDTNNNEGYQSDVDGPKLKIIPDDNNSPSKTLQIESLDLSNPSSDNENIGLDIVEL